MQNQSVKIIKNLVQYFFMKSLEIRRVCAFRDCRRFSWYWKL